MIKEPKIHGETIEYYRLQAGITKSELARHVGVSTATPYEWETVSRDIKATSAYKLCMALEIDFTQLFEPVDKKSLFEMRKKASDIKKEITRSRRIEYNRMRRNQIKAGTWAVR